MASEVYEIAGGGENALGPLRDFDAGLGERDLTRPPLHQFGTDFPLEFAHLHGQSRLGDRAVRRRSPENAGDGRARSNNEADAG